MVVTGEHDTMATSLKASCGFLRDIGQAAQVPKAHDVVQVAPRLYMTEQTIVHLQGRLKGRQVIQDRPSILSPPRGGQCRGVAAEAKVMVAPDPGDAALGQ